MLDYCTTATVILYETVKECLTLKFAFLLFHTSVRIHYIFILLGFTLLALIIAKGTISYFISSQ